MEKIKSRFARFKSTWKSIQFLSFKETLKRLLIVLVTMVVLALCIVGLDFVFGNGFKAISTIDLDINVLKIIMSIVLLLSSIVMIVLVTLARPRSRGIGIMGNSDSYMSKNKKTRMEERYHNAIRISAIVCVVATLVMYIV